MISIALVVGGWMLVTGLSDPFRSLQIGSLDRVVHDLVVAMAMGIGTVALVAYRVDRRLGLGWLGAAALAVAVQAASGSLAVGLVREVAWAVTLVAAFTALAGAATRDVSDRQPSRVRLVLIGVVLAAGFAALRWTNPPAEVASGAAALLGAGVVAIVPPVSQRAVWPYAWFGMALAALVLAAAPSGAHPLRIVGVLALLVAAVDVIGEGTALVGGRSAPGEPAEQDRETGMLTSRELYHEAQSALLAIDGATRLIGSPAFAPEQWASYGESIRSEVDRIRFLLAPTGDGRTQRFPVSRALEMAQATAELYGTDVSVEVDGEVEAMGDVAAVTQVLCNLVHNAERHAPGSPVELRAVRVGTRVVIGVGDRGPGVPEEERAAIFEPGYTTHEDGSGLGLTIAKRLVERQEGRLRVEPRIGGGVWFVLDLQAANGSHPESGFRFRAETVENTNEGTDIGDHDGVTARRRPEDGLPAVAGPSTDLDDDSRSGRATVR
jgi:anti-sigma regulatory factor (Ser/Thr protein kinase)